MPLELDDDVVLHRLSLDEYHRLIDAGAFEDRAPFELIDGLLVATSPRSEEHDAAIIHLDEWLVLGVDRERYAVGPMTAPGRGSTRRRASTSTGSSTSATGSSGFTVCRSSWPRPTGAGPRTTKAPPGRGLRSSGGDGAAV